MSKVIVVAVLHCLEAVAFRVMRSNKTKLGDVGGLYTFGSPRSASPGFVKSVDNPCFPGWRAWTGDRFLLLGEAADQVPMLPAPAWYEHPMMDSYEWDVSSVVGSKQALLKCGRTAQKYPWYRIGDLFLHMRQPYVESAHEISEYWGNVTDIATLSSYIQDPDYVKKRCKAMGWNLVGRGYDSGGNLAGGAQVSYLLQRPDTLECFLTFQGTNSAADLITDALGTKSHFCGFVQPGEKCGLFENCKPKKKGDSFVHLGFRDHLRRITQSDLFQTSIRPKLGFCSKVNVGGHSLGGALSELFSACVARAPEPGQYGYEEDFKHLSWTTETPRLMDEIDV